MSPQARCICIAVYAKEGVPVEKPADVTVTGHGFYLTDSPRDAVFTIVVPLHDGEDTDAAAARAAKTLELPAGTRIAWTNAYPLALFVPTA